jgi:beta-lactam-binding protein with PASTA domain
MRRVSCLLLCVFGGVLAGCGAGNRTVTVTTTIEAASSGVTVPLLIGLTERVAVQKVQSARLTVAVKRRKNAGVPPAVVYSQTPPVGTRTLRGSLVTILVSTG